MCLIFLCHVWQWCINQSVSRINFSSTYFYAICVYFQEALIDALSDETQRIQEQVYYGQMMSDTDVLAKFLSEAGIQRYNPKV